MVMELLLYGLGYVIPGLLTARQVKFAVEDSDNLERRQGAWRARHQGHAMNHSQTTCFWCTSDDHIPASVRNPVPLAAVPGATWPVAIPAIAASAVMRVTVKGLRPAVHWFFENPKTRKARRNNPSVSGVTTQ